MTYVEHSLSDAKFLNDSLELIHRAFDSVFSELNATRDQEILHKLRDQFGTGKMLRSRLGMVLCTDNIMRRDEVVRACAATELIHAATLFHDDVIDGASIRRNQPSLWREIGSTGAILMGDLFFSTAVQLLVGGRDVELIASFVDKVREVCATEMVHEIVFRDNQIEVDTSIQVARGKTGPLFAFIAEACGGADRDKSEAFKEAGYLLGTAYQLADDLLDVSGNEEEIGKTLGTDCKRRKYTLAQDKNVPETFVKENIQRLCSAAFKYVEGWPEVVPRLEQYVAVDLLPFLDLTLQNEMEQVVAYEVG